ADNKIIWATGPLTGTMASTGGRYTVITKGPLTGAIACSNSGGYWGAELKMAGWDMVIFEGKSAKPVYLYVCDDVAELRDAEQLWGKSVWQTEDMLKKAHQDPLLRISSIGKAGENGVLYAAVVNDLHRAAGRSGVGAVMGSKNLKAIAVRGTKGVGNIRDPKAFMAASKAAKKVLADNAVTGQGLPTYGTQVLMNVINEIGALPTRNHRDVQFEGAKDISAEAMATPRKTDGKAQLVTNQACFGCTIACGRISKMDETHFSVQNKPEYWGASGGLEYEAAWALGAANGVNDLEALQYANLICNEEGFDPISFGATIGAVMELYEMGVLTAAQIGTEAPFGSAKALCELADMTAKGIGFGKEIGLGSKRLTAKYGHPDLSMSVKGQEFPAYDGRVVQGIGLAYATSNRGACHLRGYTIASEVLGIPVKTEPTESNGKPELVKAFQDATAAFDSAGVCIFTSFAWTLADVAPQVQAACGEEFTMEHLNHIGERIWNMEREFNNAAGFTKADDTLPKRLLTEAAKTGPGKGVVSKLPEMLPKYYEVRGWDSEGRPTAQTKQRLGL
ncbi:MAG: putative oxidoreductase YdhV, partial [Pseudomonadota bacterium]